MKRSRSFLRHGVIPAFGFALVWTIAVTVPLASSEYWAFVWFYLNAPIAIPVEQVWGLGLETSFRNTCVAFTCGLLYGSVFGIIWYITARILVRVVDYQP